MKKLSVSPQEKLQETRSPGTDQILHEQNGLLETILDAIPDFISLQDHKGRYISVNRAFCEMLNKKRKQIIGKANKDLFSRPYAQLYDKEDQNIFNTGIQLVKENKVAGKKGLKWLHVVKIPVWKSENKIKGLVCSGRDITHLKSVQEQLNHAQKMESVGRLAAGIAHEINTPLGIILGYSQILLEDVRDKEQIYKDVSTIVKQTKFCSRIVADLLNFSHASESIISEFDINEAVKEVLNMVEHTFKLNQVMINHAACKNLLLMRGDKEKIKQVFINLLNNAFDSIEKNGNIWINTEPGEMKNEIKISITDTGPGIAKEDLNRIFEPFFTTKGPDRGTGLGLSVTFGIIKDHGGTIHVMSPVLSEKKGTRFTIVLPTGLDINKGALNG